MPRPFALLAALLLCICAPLLTAKTEWIHARTEHFEVFSSVGKTSTVDMIKQLEDIHVVFGTLFSQKPKYTVRTLVILCAGEKEIEPFRKRDSKGRASNAVGIFFGNLDMPALIIEEGWTSDSSRAVVYKGMASVMVETLVSNAPFWFDIGFSSVFSTVELDRKSFSFGKADGHSVGYLRDRSLIPLSKLVVSSHNSPDYADQSRKERFVAQCWAFVHMCFFGEDRSMSSKLKTYLVNEGRERDKVALMERVFGMKMDDLDRALSRYIERGRYTMMDVQLPGARDPKVEFLPLTQVEWDAARLGLLTRIHQKEEDKAAVLGTYRLLLDSDNEFLCAQAAKHCRMLNERELSLQLAERAIALKTANPQVYIDYLRAELRTMPLTVSYRMPEDVAERLRAWVDRGLELYPTSLELLNALAYVEAFAPKIRTDKMKLIQEAANSYAERDQLLLMLSYIRWRYGDMPTAKKIMEALKKECGDKPPRMTKELERYLQADKPWKPIL